MRVQDVPVSEEYRSLSETDRMSGGVAATPERRAISEDQGAGCTRK
ncbi:MAG TPA: hypothetical protein VI728_06450 [Syntrophales bacterium]|nr:hypothetical protein [Syntrophales bacterium]